MGDSTTGAPRARLLLVTARALGEVRRGDQLRAAQFLTALSPCHHVDLLTPAPGAVTTTADPVALSPVSGRHWTYRRTTLDRGVGVLRAAVRGEPLQSGLYGSADLRRRLGRIAADYDLVVVQMVRQAEVLASLAPGRSFVDLIDALSLNFARRAARQRGLGSGGRRRLLAAEARRLERLELAVLRSAAGVAVVSRRDREHLLGLLPASPADAGESVSGGSRGGGGRDDVAARLHHLPLPVSRQAATIRRDEIEWDLILTGNLGYWVNRDALDEWLRRVWPGLRRRRPGLRLAVAGDRPGRALARRLESAGATLVSSPESLRAVLRRARVAIAPMQAGAGVPVKVLEAFAEGVPVVASPWAAAGVGAPERLPLAVAESPEQWIEEVERLLDARAFAERQVAAARDFVGREHDPDECARRVRQAVSAALAATGRSLLAV